MGQPVALADDAEAVVAGVDLRGLEPLSRNLGRQEVGAQAGAAPLREVADRAVRAAALLAPLHRPVDDICCGGQAWIHLGGLRAVDRAEVAVGAWCWKLHVARHELGR